LTPTTDLIDAELAALTVAARKTFDTELGGCLWRQRAACRRSLTRDRVDRSP
jgi:hypothetical protein